MWLKNSAPKGYEFDRVSPEKIATSLKIRKKALHAARTEQHETDSDSFDAAERDVINVIKQQYYREQNKALNWLRYLENDRNISENVLRMADFDEIPASSIDIVNGFVHQSEDTIVNAYDLMRETKNNLFFFKTKHDLDEPAHYPESRILYIVLAIILLLAETVGNAWFLRVGQVGGWVGGIGLALFISAINVGLSIAVGRFFLPQANHRIPSHKVGGWLAFAIYLPFIVALNLVVGHYRSLIIALAAEEGFSVATVMQAGFDALNSIGRLGSLDFQSALLIVLGLLVAFLALADGYMFDDKYPGYGTHDRKYRRAAEGYERQKTTVRDQVNKVFTDCLGRLETVSSECNKALDRWQRRTESTEVVFQKFSDGIQQLEDAAEFVLSVYRALYQETIKALGKPQQPQALKPWSFDDAEKDPLKAFYAIAQDFPSLEQKRQFIKDWQDNVRNSYQRARKMLHDGRKQALDGVSELLRKVEGAADTEVRRELVREFAVVKNATG